MCCIFTVYNCILHIYRYTPNYTYISFNKFQQQKWVIGPHTRDLNVIRLSIMQIREQPPKKWINSVSSSDPLVLGFLGNVFVRTESLHCSQMFLILQWKSKIEELSRIEREWLWPLMILIRILVSIIIHKILLVHLCLFKVFIEGWMK